MTRPTEEERMANRAARMAEREANPPVPPTAEELHAQKFAHIARLEERLARLKAEL
jgi:hypothetical protein